MKSSFLKIDNEVAVESFLRNGRVKKTIGISIEDWERSGEVHLQPHSRSGLTNGHIGLPRDWRVIEQLSEKLSALANELKDEELSASGIPAAARWNEVALESISSDLVEDAKPKLYIEPKSLLEGEVFGAYVSFWKKVDVEDLIPSQELVLGLDQAIETISDSSGLTHYEATVSYTPSFDPYGSNAEYTLTVAVAVKRRCDIEDAVREVCSQYFITTPDDHVEVVHFKTVGTSKGTPWYADPIPPEQIKDDYRPNSIGG